MADQNDPETTLAEAVSDHLRFATASERIGCAISALRLPLEFIGELVVQEPGLAPELKVAVTGIEETTAALTRAHQFLTARLEVRNAQLLGRNPHEGGSK